MNFMPQTVSVYDPAMCCSSGVCGPEVDPKLVQFAADLEWLKTNGVIVKRHNLTQDAIAFSENSKVKEALTAKGEGALPLLQINGDVAFSGRYPTRGELASTLNLKLTGATEATAQSDCCSDGECC